MKTNVTSLFCVFFKLHGLFVSYDLCAPLKQAFSIHQIGLPVKLQASHGYDRKSWFRRSGKGHKFLYVEDIWKAECVFPLQHKPSSGSKLSIVHTPAAAAQTLPLDSSEENQENSGKKVCTPVLSLHPRSRRISARGSVFCNRQFSGPSPLVDWF